MASFEKHEKVFQCQACWVRFTVEDTLENLKLVKCPRSCTRAPVRDITDAFRERVQKRRKERLSKMAAREKMASRPPEPVAPKVPVLKARSHGR